MPPCLSVDGPFRPRAPPVDESDEVSIKDVSQMVLDAVGFQGPVVHDETRADGQFKKTASNAKLRRSVRRWSGG